MKTLAWRVVFASLVMSPLLIGAEPRAEAKGPMRVAVFAIGSGTGSDQGSATQTAMADAQGKLVCVGSLENVQTHGTGCVQTGDSSYVCTAVSNATCILG